ncbi:MULTISPECIES: MipA/OmpV family protein [Rhodanobacter]|uniref:Outer membrane protein V n=1 Tax=Rhodanobacter denitrificans TaxID=666685 RepID=M4NC85_9GAMM|nr:MULTISPECIES: MipA/OmpV family protein [Rhodanobacter]AGG88239.1 outer membrane protein V [Rhodanobacter denitrificans]KZC21081.1 structural protein MipA [Rhodanobacter denitrificans]UJJ59085.1 MipA/OmpV family protein [Rhodanobacter denitrificans]UJM87385.1 MipA/OmpV family protein [Rhodanobacter denitrificans]UJM94880.1 MipA/OmpV family protein [Rhodanobacter denitrificans]
MPNHCAIPLQLGLLLAACLLWLPGCTAAAEPTTLAVGVGMQRMPSWPGASNQHSEPLPYIDIELPGRGSFSTLDGLQIQLVHGDTWHAGIHGDYQWGRSRDDLGSLGGKIPSLAPRINLGGYLEWQLNRQLDVGGSLRHDINGAGAYLELYAEWDPPPIGLLEQSFELHWQAMNAPAMNRFFGIGPQAARALSVRAWQPGAGSQLASLEYNLFMPTSRHTGMALALVYGRLLGDAADSPLVTRYGSRTQLSESLAFVYHL